MATDVKPIPEGYSAVTPYLTIKGAAKALDFYRQAFGAEERMRLSGPGGSIMHAEIAIGGSVIMLSDEAPEWNALSPQTIGGSGSTVMLYVDDVDAVVERAAKAGATVTMPPADQFYGDRMGNLTDPFGHKWAIATHVEDVAPDEIDRRAQQLFAQGDKKA